MASSGLKEITSRKEGIRSVATVRCTNCQRPYPESGTPYRCPICSGLYDYAEAPFFDPTRVDNSQPGIWRYRHTFAVPDDYPALSLGEGNTPLVWASAFDRQVAFKCEFNNPTGSFKDRGTAALVGALAARGVSKAVEDSSGNAGASFAAYASRAGIKARVYAPESASGPKRRQIEAYGADLVSIPGARSAATQAVQQAAESGLAYASHAYLPFNLPGYATLAYELFEAFQGAPGAVVAPAGQGGLLLGIARGFTALQEAGLMPTDLPQLICVQAAACAPLWAMGTIGPLALELVSENPTVAEGVRVRFPLRGDAVVDAVKKSRGYFVAVDEDKIMAGRDELAKRGLYVEPTSALVWQALSEVLPDLLDPVVAVLTGSGYKSPAQ
jgi:threonine synthase